MRSVRCLFSVLAISVTTACGVHVPGINPPPGPLRILVYNIHAGKDAAGTPNLQAVAALVKSSGAQIALLQEVDRGTARSGHVDQVAALAKATGYDAAFGPSLLHYDGGEY